MKISPRRSRGGLPSLRPLGGGEGAAPPEKEQMCVWVREKWGPEVSKGCRPSVSSPPHLRVCGNQRYAASATCHGSGTRPGHGQESGARVGLVGQRHCSGHGLSSPRRRQDMATSSRWQCPVIGSVVGSRTRARLGQYNGKCTCLGHLAYSLEMEESASQPPLGIFWT